MGVRRKRKYKELQDDDDDNDDSIPEQKFDEFTASLRNLDGKKKLQPPSRIEPSFQVSEFHLAKRISDSSKPGNESVSVKDLAQLLVKKPNLAPIHDQFCNSERKAQKLPKPLEKIIEKKLKRQVGYGHLKKDLDKWNSIVETNRVADQLSFPLQKTEVEVYNDCDILSTFSNPTPLEEAMAEVLGQSEVAQKDKKKDDSRHKKFKLSLQEMIERRNMIAKVRAQESHLAVKAKYQKKIKSKKYHRFLRKDKIKKQLKKFENLKKSDPEAALEQLNQLENVRAEERATLRHRNTGRWAKNLAVRAKFDKESRLALAEQISQSRALTQKMATNSSDESEGEEPEVTDAANNPWVEGKPANEVDEFFSGYRKYWMDKKKNVEEIKMKEYDKFSSANVCDKNSDNCEMNSESVEIISVKKNSSPKKKMSISSNKWTITPIAKESDVTSSTIKDVVPNEEEVPVIEKSFKKGKVVETGKVSKKGKTPDKKKVSEKPTSVKNTQASPEQNISSEKDIDPNKVINIKPKPIKSGVPDHFSAGDILDEDEDDDNTEDPQLTIAQAFVDDDIVNEFREEKNSEKKKSEIREEDSNLPGWGYWAGWNMKKDKAPLRRRRRIMKAPPVPPRLDQNKGAAIIFEEENKSIKKLLVDVVPFPFKSVQDYESSIRTPIGRTWVPETACRKLIAPPVVTKLGTIIDPMDKSELLKNESLKVKN